MTMVNSTLLETESFSFNLLPQTLHSLNPFCLVSSNGNTMFHIMILRIDYIT